MNKVCRKCGISKDIQHFNRDKSRPDGHKSQCRECVAAVNRAYTASKAGKESNRRQHMRRNYGITIDEYEELERKQGGLCAICGGGEVIGRRLAVDHCHKSGKVRGLLCQACNTALGKFKDSPELLANAIKYLQENQ